VKSRSVIPRALAQADVDEAIDWYMKEGGEAVALGFVDALEQVFTHIGRQSATGSPRYAHALNLPGLRHWGLNKYPWLVFYVERPDHIDVWRVLHAERDISAWMHKPEAL